MLETRMLLYFVFAGVSVLGSGLSFDPATSQVTITFSVDNLSQIFISGGGLVGFLGTFGLGRMSKSKGGRT